MLPIHVCLEQTVWEVFMVQFGGCPTTKVWRCPGGPAESILNPGITRWTPMEYKEKAKRQADAEKECHWTGRGRLEISWTIGHAEATTWEKRRNTYVKGYGRQWTHSWQGPGFLSIIVGVCCIIQVSRKWTVHHPTPHEDHCQSLVHSHLSFMGLKGCNMAFKLKPVKLRRKFFSEMCSLWVVASNIVCHIEER